VASSTANEPSWGRKLPSSAATRPSGYGTGLVNPNQTYPTPQSTGFAGLEVFRVINRIDSIYMSFYRNLRLIKTRSIDNGALGALWEWVGGSCRDTSTESQVATHFPGDASVGVQPMGKPLSDHGICLQCGYIETSRETSQRRKRTRRKSFKGKLQYVLDWYPPLNSLIAAIVKSQLSVLIHLICAGNYNVTDGCYTATGTCDQDDYINSRVSSWKKQSSCLVSSFTSSHCLNRLLMMKSSVDAKDMVTT